MFKLKVYIKKNKPLYLWTNNKMKKIFQLINEGLREDFGDEVLGDLWVFGIGFSRFKVRKIRLESNGYR
jgi:hypothetical protein